MLRAPSSGLSGASASAGVTRRPAHQEYLTRLLSIRPSARLACWMLNEPSGTTIVDSGGAGRNGVYSAVTLGQPGLGDGRTSALFDGTTSYGNIYSAGLASAFNGSEGSAVIWFKVLNAGVLTDGLARRMLAIAVDTNNRVFLFKNTIANDIRAIYTAGGVVKTFSLGPGNSFFSTDWASCGLTWSKSADLVMGYLNGAPYPPSALSGLGVWAGAPAATTTAIGAFNTTPTNQWAGWLSRATIWNAALTDAEMYAAGTR